MSRSFGEVFEDAMAWVGGYDPHSERAQQKLASTIVLVGAVGVSASCSVVLLWKKGVFQRFIPAPILDVIEKRVEQFAALTEPPRSTKLEKTSAAYLRQVYSRTVLNFGVSFLGTYGFFRFPHFPLPLALGLSGFSGYTIVCMDRRSINPRSRQVIALAAALGCGYCFGPINWIALDTTMHLGVSVLATGAGFSAAAAITRGKVSFFLLSQLLSSSLAVIGSTCTVKLNLDYSSSTARTQTSMAVANVNTVLMVQVVSNAVLAVFHSLPTLSRFEERAAAHDRLRREQNIPPTQEVSGLDDEARFGSDDVDREAMVIFSAAAYTTWTWFRYTFTQVMLRIFGSQPGKSSTTLRSREHEAMHEAALWHDRLSRISDFSASVVFLLCYVKFVGYMQSRATVAPTLDNARRAFVMMSPFVIL